MNLGEIIRILPEDLQDQGIRFYKGLALTDDTGPLMTDGIPVFASPHQRRIDNCGGCGGKYGPLVYTEGQATAADHLHGISPKDEVIVMPGTEVPSDPMIGGIYLYDPTKLSPEEFITREPRFTEAWFAEVIPAKLAINNIGHPVAKAVYTDRIFAPCRHPDRRHLIEQGLLKRKDDQIVPICEPGLVKPGEELLPFQFRRGASRLSFTG